MGTMTALGPQPSAVVVGAVIAAALATLVLTFWMWWPKLRTAFLRRRTAVGLWWGNRRRGVNRTWLDDVEIATLWSALWLRKREEPFRVFVDDQDITQHVRGVQFHRLTGRPPMWNDNGPDLVVRPPDGMNGPDL